MKKICIMFMSVVVLVSLLSVRAAALEISVEDEYSTGEVVFIKVFDDHAAAPADYAVELIKPNGETASIQLRQGRWSGETEYFESYTIEMMGQHQLTVTNDKGETATTNFNAQLFTRNSVIFMVVSVVIFAVSFIVSAKGRKAHKEERS